MAPLPVGMKILILFFLFSTFAHADWKCELQKVFEGETLATKKVKQDEATKGFTPDETIGVEISGSEYSFTIRESHSQVKESYIKHTITCGRNLKCEASKITHSAQHSQSEKEVDLTITPLSQGIIANDGEREVFRFAVDGKDKFSYTFIQAQEGDQFSGRVLECEK